MAWDQGIFEDALRRKYAIAQQNADTSQQDVTQKPQMQDAANQAAMDRTQLGANTQLGVAQLNDQGAIGRALLQGQAQRDVTGMNNQGAMARTQLSTDTQRDIAGQNNTLEQNRLNQQGTQFDQTLDLNQAKAQEQAYQGRLGLGRATVTHDLMGNPVTVQGLDFNNPPKVGVTGGFGLSAMSDDDLQSAAARARRQAAMGQ